jgi:ribonuclease HII
MNRAPTLAVERVLWDEEHRVVVGVDEVGRGSWAGPIMVGAAVLPQDRRVYRVRDSKMLREPERERLFDRLTSWCTAWAVGSSSQEECDDIGMAGNWDFVGLGCTRRIVKGDATCLSIATASILAKVTRDRIMRAEDEHYPGYEFDSNKGYPCPRHKMALHAYGPSAIHRRTWIFMEHLVWGVAGSRATPRSWLPVDEPDDSIADQLSP